MTGDSKKITVIMQEAINLSQKTFGNALRKVWLFGSYARGDADVDSDVDFMVVLSHPIDTWKVIDTVFSEFSVNVLNRYDELPSVFITDERRFNAEQNAFYETVRKEGVLFYG